MQPQLVANYSYMEQSMEQLTLGSNSYGVRRVWGAGILHLRNFTILKVSFSQACLSFICKPANFFWHDIFVLAVG